MKSVDPLRKLPARLLRASFTPPQFHVSILGRPRLLKVLDQALRHRLLLLDGPAGCGKTTLLCQWYEALKKRRTRAAWLSICRSGPEPADLVLCLAWALHLAGLRFVSAGMLIEETYDHCDPFNALAAVLAELRALEEPIVLLLDDIDQLHTQPSRQLIDALVEEAPPNLSIVMASRARPGFSWGHLQARGLVYRVGSQELMFTATEARAVLRDSLSPTDAETLLTLTDGWPIAVQLAKLSFQHRPLSRENLAAFQAPGGDIAVYLAEQVVASLPPPIHSFLSDTSILECLTPELVDAIRERGDSDRMLYSLEAYQPLLLILDRTQRQYRLHPLLRDFLRDSLRTSQPEAFNALNRRAARALAAQGRLREGVQHAVAAGNVELGCLLLSQQRPVRHCVIHGAGEVKECIRLLGAIDWRQHPRIWMAQQLIQWREGRVAQAAADFAASHTLYPHLSVECRLESLIVRAVLASCYSSRCSAVLDECEREYAACAREEPIVRASLNTFAAVANIQNGRFEAAGAALTHSALHFNSPSTNLPGLYLDLHWAWIGAARGQLADSVQCLRKVIRRARHLPGGKNLISAARIELLDVQYELGALNLELGEISALLGELERCDAWFDLFALGYRVAVRAAQLREGMAAALNIIELGRLVARQRAMDDGLPRLLDCLEAELLAHAGDSFGAQERLASALIPKDCTPTVYERDALASARVTVALRSGQASIALVAADEWISAVTRENRGVALIRATILRGVCLRSLGRIEADEQMHKAVILATPQRVVGPFIEASVLWHESLETLRTDEVGVPEVAQHLERLRTQCGAGLETNSLLGRLSPREREILHALTAGGSNKQVARDLGVTKDAIKFHLKNVFRKLGVHSRGAALALVHSRSIEAPFRGERRYLPRKTSTYPHPLS
jgi:LuxR family maltose regulon positive regulatory protein